MADLVALSGAGTETLSRLRALATNQYVGAGRRAAEHALANSFWETVHRALTATAAVFAALAGGSILADADGAWRTVAGICALFAAVLSPPIRARRPLIWPRATSRVSTGLPPCAPDG
jgi:hypothetical protein